MQGRHPLQISAAVQLGPSAIALAISLNKELGLSFGKIATLFPRRFGLHVTPRHAGAGPAPAAATGQPTYTALCETVRASPIVVPDETRWKVQAWLWWL